MAEKLVLAYSGGLDTSCILKWLVEKGYAVVAFCADVGQEEDFKAAEEKAYALGASKVYIKDLKEEFVTDYIFQALKGNAMYEGRYLLGTSLARPLIAKHQVEIAKEEGAHYVAHGATGKGNDQVRFELTYFALHPTIRAISPWKTTEFLTKFKGRKDLIEYAKEKGIPVKATAEKSYSEDDNLMHISHEAGILEDPAAECPSEVYNRTASPFDAPDRETRVKIHFKDGLPLKVENLDTGETKQAPLDILHYLNKLGSENGIGREDMVENRYVGIKSRGVYETPGATILWTAHRDIEGIAMDKEVMHLRDSLAPRFSQLIYHGYWFSPEMDFLMSAFNHSQLGVDGWVTLSLYKGNVTPIARWSPTSLYNKELSSMDAEGGFNQMDSAGFIRINALRLKMHKPITDKSALGRQAV